jgi:Domain of unknown function (DUF5666)
MRASYGFFVTRHRVMVAMLLLAGCGIDQGGYMSPGVTGANESPQTVLVSGPIEAFGSVHVTGLVLDTSRAQIRIDGNAGSQADLKLGQVIRAVALVDKSSTAALSIDYQDNALGPVESVDVAVGELTVLGQRVRATATTRFDGAQLGGLSDLEVGDRIAVSGIAAPAKVLLATYVRRAGAAEPLTIAGTITASGSTALTFEIGALTVDYSRTAVLDVPSGSPAANVIVEVTGSTLDNGVLVADRVQALKLLPGTFTAAATTLTDAETPVAVSASSPPPQAARFVGVISTAGVGSLAFGDLEVRLTATTAVVGGTVADLVAGTRVLVQGRILALGQVEATQVQIQ